MRIVKRYCQIFRDGDYDANLDANLFEIFPENRLNHQTIKQFSKAEEIYLLNEKSNIVYVYKSKIYKENHHLAKCDFLHGHLFDEYNFLNCFRNYFLENNN